MQTYSGRQFWPLDPRADEVFIEDIAQALSMQCRFARHCLQFYSVAEHSVLLARHVSPKNRLWALLHDASEAYLVDVPLPVKPFLDGYKQAEASVMAAICDRFDLPHEMPAEVKTAYSAIIGDERTNMAPCVAEWHATGPGIGSELQYWSPERAKAEFLMLFDKLTARRAAA
ncbi:phosphohydrolase [Falsochrobactrum sp. TDYN1]|uniref:Phosphohydrolase n=1 Tax=Falsochrobactrum tianjinense TaxID=2706015 RepID=A0A949PML2_9HYPH|nr:phosphohydrolase [Falsochrobactrum sp. TDYN1]